MLLIFFSPKSIFNSVEDMDQTLSQKSEELIFGQLRGLKEPLRACGLVNRELCTYAADISYPSAITGICSFELLFFQTFSSY